MNIRTKTFARVRAAIAAIVPACALLAVQPAWSAGDRLLARIQAAGVIRIANTQSSPPWTFLNDANQPAGYDIDMAYEVARRMGIPKVEFVADAFKNFVEGLKADKYDLVMNDLTPTAERAKQVDFSSPYGVEDFRIFVRQDNTDIRSQDDLAGKRIGVTTGSSNESWSRAHLTRSEIKTYDNGGLVFADLGNRRIDAVIISHFGGLKYANVNHLPIKEVGEPLTYQLSAAAMAKDEPALRASVDQAIAAMMADGTIERIGRKWVGEQYDMVGTIRRAEQEAAANAQAGK
ncbi:cysteine ABC transporter substrate-binding protein [Bordetella genomosp. 8]|uniref:Cysteine ABC transporter substrate-binding protein n=1 Tax=Bordetella genomosp. 8 TaxID=1416806 RepID=A0A1W6YTQ5_9BORD|nr:ABC transporter substrate-binding protein [Bordetella genomosp. 8]ARP83983.1 cysteine ABC transporter substrate-binding protein [Bordetella genomosp. 8]